MISSKPPTASQFAFGSSILTPRTSEAQVFAAASLKSAHETKLAETKDVANAISGLKSTTVPDPEYQ